jgi:hypothetical protein
MMKLAIAVTVLSLAACGSKSKPPTGNTGGTAATPGDVDGDGKADEVTFADGVVTVAGATYTVPADTFSGVAAHVVDLGTETVVVVDSEIMEDDLSWHVLRFHDGALHHVGDVFLGGDPGPEGLPGDGTIHAHLGNCGQSTEVVYRITDGKIAKTETTTGTYDENQCAACPYVLVDTGDGLAFVGESLRNLVGRDRATEDTLALPALSGQRELVVVLSEVKPETTFLDAIAVDFDGTLVAPRACAAPGSACAADGDHEVFTLGERRRFVFDVPAGFTGRPLLRARGYYEPFSPTVAR